MRTFHAMAATALLALTATSAPQRYDWSGEDLAQSYGFEGEYLDAAKASQNACRANLAAEPPAADWPTPAERAVLKGCDSEALYYGIGMPANPVAARKCALIEREGEVGPNAPEFGGLGDSNSYFSGTGILAMVYANGRGAARNLPVAIHMACGVEDAPAASESRIEALVKQAADGTASEPFEICDNATSGISDSYCADHAYRIAHEQRGRRIAALAQHWTAVQQALFAKAYSSLQSYADVAHQMDCYGGTAFAACNIWGADADEEDFVRRIEAFAAGHEPAPRERRDGDGTSPALVPLDLSEIEPDQRPAYRANYQEAVAARAAFERDLLAFMQATFPAYSRHQVRQMFRDL